MLISLTGSNSTGKTTLLKKCKEIYSSQFTFAEEITRKIARQGIPINTNGGNLTQLLIINEHIQNSLLENAILDRCILDGLCYTEYLYNHSKIGNWVYTYANHVYDMLLPKYDIIFYCSPVGVPLENDGTREVGTMGDKFRNGVLKRFEYHMAVDERLAKKIVVLEGTVEERMEIIKKTISERLKI
jgi:nicotinamide riboside kinase